jgi:lysozyme
MNKIVKTGPKGIALIHSFETCVLKPYRCPAGIPTIGWGNTFYEDGTKVTMKDPPITQDRANKLFEFILKQFERDVDSYCIDTINQNQFDALVSFAYNCGSQNLKTSTLIKKVNKNINDPAIVTEFAKWNKSAGKVLAGLVRRRKAEAELYFSA